MTTKQVRTIMVSVAVLAAGCEPAYRTKVESLPGLKDGEYQARMFTEQGHDYIAFVRGGGIHSEACQCRTNGPAGRVTNVVYVPVFVREQPPATPIPAATSATNQGRGVLP